MSDQPQIGDIVVATYGHLSWTGEFLGLDRGRERVAVTLERGEALVGSLLELLGRQDCRVTVMGAARLSYPADRVRWPTPAEIAAYQLDPSEAGYPRRR